MKTPETQVDDATQSARNAAERNLLDYRNADGRAPGGPEPGAADDTPAVRAALAEGPGVVFVPAGA